MAGLPIVLRRHHVRQHLPAAVIRLAYARRIAVVPTGLLVVEANGAPDLDIMQRPFRQGLIRGRLGELLAHNLLRSRAIPSSYEVRFGKAA